MNDRVGVRPLGLLLVVSAMLLFSPPSRAQNNPEETRGVNWGNYNIEQSAESGYRSTWINGDQNSYDTFVDLHSGLRLFDYTLGIRSLNHQGLLFDNLSFSNFGYGGDPNDVSRLRVEKNKWYDFQLVFRRDNNFWNYALLANPLNPASASSTAPAFAVTDTPHALNLVRRMQDYKLTLLPESRIRFRLGYSRYVNEGPAYTSYHGTTEFQLVQNFRTTTNEYHFGVDFRFLPKTSFSYDQFLEYYKQDTSAELSSLPFLLSTAQFPGTAGVDLGLDWYYPPSATTAPCLTPFPSGYPGYASPTCKGYLSYSNVAPGRNFMPTEQLSFQSSYFRNLQMSGAVSYNNGNIVFSAFNDNANEWTNPSNVNTSGQVRGAITSGPASAKRVFAHANWSGRYSVTRRFRILDSVNYDYWRSPGFFNQLAENLFATLPQATGQTGMLLPVAQFSPLVDGAPTFASICPGPAYNAVTCPEHGTSAAPDVQDTLYANFLGQKKISNIVQIEGDFTKRISARIGYLYERRDISESSASVVTGATYYPGGAAGTAANYYLAARGTGTCAIPTGTTGLPAGCTLNADGSITYVPAATTASTVRDVTTINEQVGIVGLTLRPMDSLRINSDFQFGYNDFSYTRVWPRQIQSYKVHVNFTPRTWINVDGAVDIHENRDNISQVFSLEHSRTYLFAIAFEPNSKLTFDLGYNYTDIYLQTFICFRDTGPGVATFDPCPFNGGSSTVNLGALAFYDSGQHYAYSDVMWKPWNRVTARVGYLGTFVGGNTLYLNPRQPGGTISFTYQKPFATIQIDLYKGLSYKTSWNYYGYNEKTPIDMTGLVPIGSQNFTGNTATFSVRYGF
jgi:hypothetical protein